MQAALTWGQIVACALYIFFPLDLLPDPIPFLGMGDDCVAMWHMIRQLQQTGTIS